jgi:hypothetical protein
MLARIALATAVFVGCVASPPPTPDVGHDPLAVHRRAWESSRPHSYAFTYREQCMCEGGSLWVRVWVDADTLARAELLPVQDPGTRRSSAFRRPTVDSLFAWLADAYARKADRIEAQYDPRYHFPSHAAIDWKMNVIDDEFEFEVRDFAPIASHSAR